MLDESIFGHRVITEGEEPRRRTIYVSSVVRAGCTMDDVNDALSLLAGLVRREDESCPSPPSPDEATIDVTFHLPGAIARPNFEGIRTGRWLKDEKLLVVQVAVPEALSGGSDTANAFVARSLVDAVGAAARHLTKQGLDVSAERARRIAIRVATLLP